MEYITEKAKEALSSNKTLLITELVYFQNNNNIRYFPGQLIPLEDIKSGEIPLSRPNI
jgi:hypothetical protein